MSSLDLFDLAQQYLDAVVLALADTPGGAPSVSYVSPGLPAFDCDQVTVHVGGPIIAPTTPPGGALGIDHRVTVAEVDLIRMTAIVIRCCPVFDDDGNPPPAADQTAAARQTTSDVWAVWAHVKDDVRNKTLFGSANCREFSFEPAIPVNIEGGLCGWQIPMHVQLDGYRPGT